VSYSTTPEVIESLTEPRRKANLGFSTLANRNFLLVDHSRPSSVCFLGVFSRLNVLLRVGNSFLVGSRNMSDRQLVIVRNFREAAGPACERLQRGATQVLPRLPTLKFQAIQAIRRSPSSPANCCSPSSLHAKHNVLQVNVVLSRIESLE
jgi:hypothetical protein